MKFERQRVRQRLSVHHESIELINDKQLGTQERSLVSWDHAIEQYWEDVGGAEYADEKLIHDPRSHPFKSNPTHLAIYRLTVAAAIANPINQSKEHHTEDS